MTQNEFLERYHYNPNEDKIGGGGFGVVFKAYDKERNRYVAIKESQVKDHQFTLLREVELSNELEPHLNTIRFENCYRFSVMRATMDYAILKYYELGSLDSLLKNKQLELNEKIALVQGVLNGMAHLHKEGVVHRDLKCANILIDMQDGAYIPKISDFGLSRFVDVSKSSIDNSAIGNTIAYAAPEQILGKPIKKNVDIWAIGVISYKIFTGELPFFAGENADFTTAQIEVSKKILNLELPAKLKQIPEPFQKMIRTCWVLDTQQRVQSIGELQAILKQNHPNAYNNKVENKPENKKTENLEKTWIDDRKPVASDSEKTLIDAKAIVVDSEKTLIAPSPQQKPSVSPQPIIAENPTRKKEDEKKKTTPLIIGAGIVLLGLFVGFMVWNSKSEKVEEKVAATPDSTTQLTERGDQSRPITPAPTSENTTKVAPIIDKKTQTTTAQASTQSTSTPDNVAMATNAPTQRVVANVEEEMKAKSIPTETPTRFQDIDGDRYTYKGELKNGKPDGKGEAMYDNGEKYVGSFKEGLKKGFGKCTKDTGDIYEGEFNNDKPNGKGVIILKNKLASFPNAVRFEGTFVNGNKVGIGTYYDKEGNILARE